jgi:hypothetical protein
MRSARLALAAAVVSMAGAPALAHAQAAQRGGQLFISPNGQPFRAPAGAPYPVAQWFAQADKRGDGKVDRAEFGADAEAFFHRLDKNGDGVIDPFELQAYEQDTVPEILGAYQIPQGRGNGAARIRASEGRRGLFGRRQQPPGDPGEASVLSGAAPYELIPDPEPVASTDFAGDGRITLAEFLRAADTRFGRLDAKHKGFLQLADLPKTLAQKEGEQAARDAAAQR